MVELNNENIIRQIFYSIKLTEVRELIARLKNKLVSYNLIRILSYENIYKTIGKTQTWLNGDDDFFMRIYDIAILPDGNIITLRTNTSSLFNIWDTNTYECIKTIEDNECLNRMILLPCDIIVTTYDYTIKFIDINKDFQCTGQINYESHRFFLLSGGKFMCFKWWEEVSLNQDFCCVSIIDYNDKLKIKEFTNQKYDICLLVNLKEDQIATGCGEEISIWDIQNDCLGLVATCKGHMDQITSLLFVEKDNVLLSGSKDMTIKAWELGDKHCIRTIKVDTKVERLLLLSNGYFAVGSLKGDINIFDLSSNECINSVKTNKEGVTNLLLLKNNKLAATIDYVSFYGWDDYPTLELGLFIFDI
jgi:WD40 repeat protein